MVTVGNETLPNMTPEMQLQVPIFIMFYVFNLQPRIFTFSIKHLSFVIPAIKKASSITNCESYYLNTHTHVILTNGPDVMILGNRRGPYACLFLICIV